MPHGNCLESRLIRLLHAAIRNHTSSLRSALSPHLERTYIFDTQLGCPDKIYLLAFRVRNAVAKTRANWAGLKKIALLHAHTGLELHHWFCCFCEW